MLLQISLNTWCVMWLVAALGWMVLAHGSVVERTDSEVDVDLSKRITTATVEAIATLAAGALATGTSVGAANLGAPYSVTMKMEIENYTKWPMASPIAYNVAGQIQVPAGHVLPGGKEAMLAHKTGGAATGTYGVVSWLVTANKRAVVMWSAPYSFDFHSNWMAVGIMDDEAVRNRGAKLADDMYYGSGDFERKEYYYHSKAAKYCASGFCIKGTMGTSHKTTIKIKLWPVDAANLSYDVKSWLKQENIDVING